MGAASDAEEALYKEITRQANALSEANVSRQVQAHVARDLAVAFRALWGGPQPGSVVVEK